MFTVSYGATPQLQHRYKRSVKFQMEIKIIFRRGFGSQTTQIVVISRCCFAWDGQEMYKVLKRTCWAIVLPIRSFVFPCPCYRRRRGLLKVPISERDIVQAHRSVQWSSSDLLLLLFNYWVCDTTSAFFISIRTKGRLLLSFSKIIGNHFIFRANRKQGSL